MIKLLLQAMSKLLLTFLLCCLVVAFTDASEENSKDLIADKVENLLADKLFVKREAVPEAGKKNKKERKKTARRKNNKGKGRKKSGRKNSKSKGKRKPRRKNNKGKGKGKPRRKNKKGKGKGKPRRKNNKGKGKKNIANGREGKKNRKNAKNTEGNGRKGKEKKKNGNKAGKGKLRKKKKSTKKGDKKKDTKVKVKTKKTKSGKRSKKGSKPKPRQNGTDYKKCVDLFWEYSKGIRLAGSVRVQTNTIKRDQKTQTNKGAKKGDFTGTHSTLLSALGGNESSLECDGTPIKNGTRKAEYKSTLSTLKGCDVNIGKMCNHTTNATFDALVESCSTIATTFKEAFENCFKGSDTDVACACMTALDPVTTIDEMNKCKNPDLKAGRDRIKIEKDECKEGFKACKQAEDKSVEGVGTCKKVNRCGGAKNKTEATRILTILKPLSAALKQTGFADTMKKLGLDSGAGSDGKLTSRLTQLRNARFADGREVRSEGDVRQTDGAGCTRVLDEWKVFNTSGDKAVPGVDSEPDAAETNKTIESLNKLNNGATLEADLGSCAKENSSRQVTVTLTIVSIRFYVFWCGWFQVTVVEVQIIILEITFGGSSPTPAPVPTPAPAPVPTSAPGGRHIVKQIMKRAAFPKNKSKLKHDATQK